MAVMNNEVNARCYEVQHSEPAFWTDLPHLIPAAVVILALMVLARFIATRLDRRWP
jgi:hypothetical protein